MVVEIRLNNTWQDISDSIIQPITIDRRVDEVLDSGTFTFVSKEIEYNIPPLTLCKIDSEYWLCSSECNEVIPSSPKEYNHNVSLIELTYYLQCYIVGTKAMSNTGTMYPTNADKCKALCDIVNDKYRLIFGNTAVKFQFEIGAFSDSRWQLEREFIFGSGTTLFQALLDIGRTCNAIPRIASAPYFDGTSEILYLSWDILDYNQTFTLDSTKILTMQYRQSVDDYTAILESEVNDVVDRTITSRINCLSVRSEEAFITDDNQVLMLPCRVENIIKFEANGTVKYADLLISGFGDHVDDEKWNSITNGNHYWTDYMPAIDTIGQNAIKYVAQQLGITITGATMFEKRGGFGLYTNAVANNVYDYKNLDITKSILEKSQYDLLALDEKPKYCYYTYNDNVIRGIYEFYKDDSIFIATVKPFLEYALDTSGLMERIKVDDRYGTSVVGALTSPSFTSYNPKDWTFNIEYIPITNTFLLSNNDKEPFNEEEVKKVSRSFELSSSMSDFDLLEDSINKNNKMLGMPEISFEYYGITYPKPRNIISIKNQNYYVSSVQTTIILGQYKSVVNLVKEYNKIAEVFGVKTQFESTKLPLNNIIGRIVYCGEFDNKSDVDSIRIKTDTFDLIKNGAVLSKSDSVYLAVEADDNYNFAKQNATNPALTSSYRENKDMPYAGDGNEQIEYDIYVGKINNNLSLDNSRNLPQFSDDIASIETDFNTVKLYKDARERLIFVAKLLKRIDPPDLIPPEEQTYSVVMQYNSVIEGNGIKYGVTVNGYKGEELVTSHTFSTENEQYTFKSINGFSFIVNGPNNTIYLGYSKFSTEIYNDFRPNGQPKLEILDNRKLYLCESNVDDNPTPSDYYNVNVIYNNEISSDINPYGIAITYNDPLGQTYSALLNQENNNVRLNNIVSLYVQLAGPSTTCLNIGTKTNRIAIAQKVYKYTFTQANLTKYNNSDIYITEVD